MQGILLAGGRATRLYPITTSINKHVLPIYNKPMIYYPLSTLINAGIRDILLITNPSDIQEFKSLLGDGNRFGIQITYLEQHKPSGIAESFIIAEKYIKDKVCLILGDNVFHSENLETILYNAVEIINNTNKSVIFGYHVKDPFRYGVVEFDENKNPIKIIEKPKDYLSSYAVMGLYFYTKEVIEIAKSLNPSSRGELEISDVNQVFLNKKSLYVKLLKDGFAWLDTGTYDSLLQASHFIQTLEQRQNILVGSIEISAYNKGFINSVELEKIIDNYGNSPYGELLRSYYENQ